MEIEANWQNLACVTQANKLEMGTPILIIMSSTQSEKNSKLLLLSLLLSLLNVTY
jgi:hypothetical protein